MKKLMMFGAVTGMAVATGFGVQQRREPVVMLLQGCLAATGGALVMRWWGRLLVRNWKEAVAQSRHAASPNIPKSTTASRRL